MSDSRFWTILLIGGALSTVAADAQNLRRLGGAVGGAVGGATKAIEGAAKAPAKTGEDAAKAGAKTIEDAAKAPAKIVEEAEKEWAKHTNDGPHITVINADQFSGSSPPAKIKDLKGEELSNYSWIDFGCSTGWNGTCSTTKELSLPDDHEYCVHHIVIQEMDHASIGVENVVPGFVRADAGAYGSGHLFDRWSGNVKGTLIVGLVPLGKYDPDRCLPRWILWPVVCDDPGRPEMCNIACTKLTPVEQYTDPVCRTKLVIKQDVIKEDEP